MAAGYTWSQDNATLSVRVKLPRGTTPEQLRLRLGSCTFVLEGSAEAAILHRRLRAAITPRRTKAYTLAEANDGRPEMRVVLFKAQVAGWSTLFVGDAPLHNLVWMAGGRREEVAASRTVAGAAFAAAPTLAASIATTAASPLTRQTWRKPTPRQDTAGKRRILFCARPSIEPCVRTADINIRLSATAPGSRQRDSRHSWRTATNRAASRPREAPLSVAAGGGSPAEEPAAGAVPTGGWQGESEASAVDAAGSCRAPEAAAKAPRKVVPAYKGRVDPEAASSSDEAEMSDGGEYREYPLPGSCAECDGCGRDTRRYYHCVQCGSDESAFDLCFPCHRRGYHLQEHYRTFALHDLKLVTPKSAPFVVAAGAPASSLQPLPAATAVVAAHSEPLQANTKYEWTQTTEEINLVVWLGRAVELRALQVDVRPQRLSVSARGHVLLAGPFFKPVRARDSIWTLERSLRQVHILLPKSHEHSWSRLFPSEEPLHPAAALKQICDDPEPFQGRYMDLTPEARGIVDLHRNHRHAVATGKEEWAAELEEDMKMMRFKWGEQNR